MKSRPPQENVSSGSIHPPSLPQKRSASKTFNWAEKRQNKRLEVSTELTFQSESNFYMGFTADISSGGIFVVTWDIMPIGSHISLDFSLQNSKKTVSVDGVVRWVREHNPNDPDLWPGMGIQFSSLSDSDTGIITQFIAEREPLFYDD